MNARRQPIGNRRRGFFLVMVLVIVTVATMSAYTFTDLMIAYDEAAYLAARQAQADQIVESGFESVRLMLAQPPLDREAAGGVFNNPAMFQAINVVPDASSDRRGNFSVVAPGRDETGRLAGLRFGLQNESARLNLNALTVMEKQFSGGAAVMEEFGGAADEFEEVSIARELLMAVPGMSEDVADAILDWLDEDDEPRPNGAELEYYSGLPSPYEPKNGPIDSVEELLLVRGVTPSLLFGADHNRNGVVDASEQSMTVTDTTQESALGWAAYLTVHSSESNLREDGSERIDVNAEDLVQLYADLGEALGNDDWASFIVAYRVAGQGGGDGGSRSSRGESGDGDREEESEGDREPPEDDRSGAEDGDEPSGERDRSSGDESEDAEPWTADALDELDLEAGGETQIGQLLDLVDARVEIGEGDDAQTFASPFASDQIAMALYMPALMENLTAQSFTAMPGRLNVNECPADLIWGLPVMLDETKQALIDARNEESDSENRRYPTWPLVEGLVTLEEMKQLMPILTTGGDVYRAQVVGYFEGANTAARAEGVIDATGPNPRLLFWRSLSHLGRGFDVAVLGVRSSDGILELQADGR